MQSSSWLSTLIWLSVPMLCCFVPLMALVMLFVARDQVAQLAMNVLMPSDLRPGNHITEEVHQGMSSGNGHGAIIGSQPHHLPDPLKKIQKIQQQYPDITPDALAQKVIADTAFNCGFAGFMTGLPGAIALPITIPVDFITTGRMHVSMIRSIAYVYGRGEIYEDPETFAKQMYMIMFGGGQVMAGSAQLARQLLPRLLGKSVTQSLPILGGFIGFGVNWAITHAIGRTTIRHYQGLSWIDTKPLTQVLETSRSVLEQSRQGITTGKLDLSQASFPTPRPQAQQSLMERTLCPSCDESNPASHRFCARCGKQLSGV